MQHQQARDNQINGRRNLGPPDVNNVEQFPPAGLGGAAALPNNLPPINMDNMVELYRRVEEGEEVDNKVMMKSVFGILLHNASNMQTVDQVKRSVQDNTDRIRALEDKVGSSDEVAVPLGLAIQHMPLPTVGTSDLQNVKEMLAEVRAPGVTVDHDVIKVVRKGNKPESRPGSGDSRLGTVFCPNFRTDEL